MGDTSLPGTILRLPMVYGPGDYQHRLFSYLKRMDDKCPAILMDETEAHWRWTHGYVENVADAIASWQGRVVSVSHGRLPEPLRWGINGEQDIVVDSSRIRRELGYRERVDLEEALKRTVAWERANPPKEIDLKEFDYEAEDAFLRNT